MDKKSSQTYNCGSCHKTRVHTARQVKFVNLYKLYFPLAFNPEIGREPSIRQFDSPFLLLMKKQMHNMYIKRK